MRNGLTGLMNDGLIFQGHNADPWAGHTWYTSSGDKGWFFAWLKRGEHEKARQTLEAQMYYGMTDAYYMMERYADNDPYWVPLVSERQRERDVCCKCCSHSTAKKKSDLKNRGMFSIGKHTAIPKSR